MKKKGQITIFILLGVIILFSFIIYQSTRNKTNIIEHAVNENIDIKPIKTYIESCLSESIEYQLNSILMTGGIVNFENSSYVLYEGNNIPIYVDDIISYPGINKIKDIIRKNVLIDLNDCNLSNFNGIEIIRDTSAVPSISLSASETDLTAIVYYPVIASRRETNVRIANFKAVVPARVTKVHATMIGLVQSIISKWNSNQVFDISNLICSSYDLDLRAVGAGNNTKVIQIIDNYSGNSLVYQFAVRKDPLDFTGNRCN